MAGGAGGHEVERIAVKVVPDTGGFAEKLRAFLERVEAASKVEVDVEANTEKARAQIKSLAKDLEVKLRVEVEQRSLQNARRQLDELRERLEAKLDIDVNAVRARQQLARLARDYRVTLVVDVDDFLAKAKLAWLTRPQKVTINVDYDRGVFNQLSGSLHVLSRQLSQIAGPGSSQLSRGLGQVSGSVGRLGTVFQYALLALLPLVILYLGALITVCYGLIVAIGGVLGALLAVAPAAAAVGGAIAFMLKDNSKQAKALKKEFEGIGKIGLNILRKSVQPVYKAIRAQIPEIRRWVQSFEKTLPEAMRVASRFVDDFAQGIMNFGSHIMGGLVAALKDPGMSQIVEGFEHLISDLGKAISLFFQELAKGGTDHKATLEALGSAMASLSVSLAKMLNAFSKVSPELINEFSTALSRLFSELSSTENLTALMTGFHYALELLIRTIGWAFDVFRLLVSTVQYTYHSVVTIWNALVAAWNWVASRISAEWNRIKTMFSNGAAWIKSKAGEAKSIVLSHFSALVSGAINWFSKLASFISSIWSRITGRTRSGANSTKAAAIGPFNGLVSAAAGIFNRLVGIVASAWDAISGIVSNIAGAIGRVSGMISNLRGMISSLPGISLFSAPISPDLALPGGGQFSLLAVPELSPQTVTFKSASIMDSIRELDMANRRLSNDYVKSIKPDKRSENNSQVVVEKNNNITINAAPNVPTERTLLTALSYADALYGT